MLPFKVLLAMLSFKLIECPYEYLLQFVLDFIATRSYKAVGNELLRLIEFGRVG